MESDDTPATASTTQAPLGEHNGAPRQGGLLLRTIAASLLFIARACTAIVWASLLGWLVGEVVSDRYYITQFLEWVPTPAVIVGAGTLLVLAWILARFHGVLIYSTASPARLFRAIRWAFLAWTALLIWFFIVEVPIFRPRPPTPAPGADHFKLVFWNAAAWYQDGWEPVLGASDPDVVILVGLGSTKGLPNLQLMMKDVASVITAERFTILSRRPITRYGFTSLGVARGQGIDPRFGKWTSTRADPGHALFFEMQNPATPKTPASSTIVHVIDLPSDLSLLRWEVTARARQSLDRFAGIVYSPDSLGRWVPHEAPAGSTPAGFPPPDIVIGDFNIPRGAASLRALSRGFPNAFDQAGRGYTASYPRRPPVFHIDQTFVGPGVRAFNYRLLDLDAGSHLAQVIDIARQ